MKFISRKDALKDPVFCSFIKGWQDISNPEKDNDMRVEGDYYDEKNKYERFYSQKELDYLFEKEKKQFKKITDQYSFDSYKMLGKIVLEDTDVSNISQVMYNFTKDTTCEFIFLPLYKKPWLSSPIKHHHAETKIAYKNFKKRIKNNSRDGFIISNPDEMKMLIPDYFTLVSANYF